MSFLFAHLLVTCSQLCDSLLTEIKGLWIKISDHHCTNKKFSTSYSTLAQAKASCLKIGASCSGVYDTSCDERGPFYACQTGAFESSTAGSCVYETSSTVMRNTVRYNDNVYDTLGEYPVDGTAVRVF